MNKKTYCKWCEFKDEFPAFRRRTVKSSGLISFFLKITAIFSMPQTKWKFKMTVTLGISMRVKVTVKINVPKKCTLQRSEIKSNAAQYIFVTGNYRTTVKYCMT